MVKNPSANAAVAGSIPGSGRSPREGNGNHSSILAWKIPCTEEPGGLQSMGFQKVRYNLVTEQQHKIHVVMYFIQELPFPHYVFIFI